MQARKLIISAAIGATLLGPCGAFAAEEGKSVYLLGAAASMAGMTPPPGAYFSSLSYYYSGSAGGDAALSRTLGQAGSELPGVGVLRTDISLRVKAQVGINVFSLLYVAPERVLGGHFGFGVLAPLGYQNVDADLTAVRSVTFPNGTILQAGRSLRVSDNTFAPGDPLAMAFIGWNSGFFHWKLTGMVNIPVGSYRKAKLVNMGFNRWATDVTGAMTYLNPQNGFELSLASGVTFNGENPDTSYKSGTEFHLEGTVMQHVSKTFALGVVGYHYQQITGDSGAGAVLGAFKGRVSAIGPNLTYNFQLGKVPVLTSVRFLREFNAKNRLAGNAGIFTLTIPLSGSASKGHGPS
ncbi:MAG: transporter [Beijerinckiaceae bacterium]|nr:transporter [Beijerinckiaceae bacterium]